MKTSSWWRYLKLFTTNWLCCAMIREVGRLIWMPWVPTLLLSETVLSNSSKKMQAFVKYDVITWLVMSLTNKLADWKPNYHKTATNVSLNGLLFTHFHWSWIIWRKLFLLSCNYFERMKEKAFISPSVLGANQSLHLRNPGSPTALRPQSKVLVSCGSFTTARDRDRDRETMSFYITLCTVHTTQGKGQGREPLISIVPTSVLVPVPVPVPCSVYEPLQVDRPSHCWALRVRTDCECQK